ncbi:hypothetical protein PFAG_00370 [Plasmodium falciparum Santa Lucia]|uniref:Uncharacterized protein n=1 Tax=Plasmodium falciparum Santa Lucia TaxID=478859 RepID=W7GC03_PLAFA|nr:hypothetical protein PFAG_00370 [Plasmodium falciparum Santa Lucia]
MFEINSDTYNDRSTDKNSLFMEYLKYKKCSLLIKRNS